MKKGVVVAIVGTLCSTFSVAPLVCNNNTIVVSITQDTGVSIPSLNYKNFILVGDEYSDCDDNHVSEYSSEPVSILPGTLVFSSVALRCRSPTLA